MLGDVADGVDAMRDCVRTSDSVPSFIWRSFSGVPNSSTSSSSNRFWSTRATCSDGEELVRSSSVDFSIRSPSREYFSLIADRPPSFSLWASDSASDETESSSAAEDGTMRASNIVNASAERLLCSRSRGDLRAPAVVISEARTACVRSSSFCIWPRSISERRFSLESRNWSSSRCRSRLSAAACCCTASAALRCCSSTASSSRILSSCFSRSRFVAWSFASSRSLSKISRARTFSAWAAFSCATASCFSRRKAALSSSHFRACSFWIRAFSSRSARSVSSFSRRRAAFSSSAF
mmetsp:Transcript_7461/g.18018  ORF Transcript_7461/g.18018 Transcript_7461/m.18018 type:complete len:294 (+) Transcript_7461:1431-2312(+)